MAQRPVITRQSTKTQSRWKGLLDNFGVAAATALGTFLVTTGIPTIKDRFWKEANQTSLSEASVAFQQNMWETNSTCAVDPSAAIWHESEHGRKIDATICPETGDIIVTMRDKKGRFIQGFTDLSDLKKQYDFRPTKVASRMDSLLFGTALAAPTLHKLEISSKSTVLSQAVICQIFLPDRRGLRRRLVVGPNQCVEILIDTFTGQVVYQRPIPCVSNCAQNV